MSFQKGTIFAQGDASDAVFVGRTGLVTLNARPQGAQETSRQAIIDIFGQKDFVGKCSIAGESLRSASACALTDCRLLRIERMTMKRALTREVTLSTRFVPHCWLGRRLRRGRFAGVLHPIL